MHLGGFWKVYYYKSKALFIFQSQKCNHYKNLFNEFNVWASIEKHRILLNLEEKTFKKLKVISTFHFILYSFSYRNKDSVGNTKNTPSC